MVESQADRVDLLNGMEYLVQISFVDDDEACASGGSPSTRLWLQQLLHTDPPNRAMPPPATRPSDLRQQDQMLRSEVSPGQLRRAGWLHTAQRN